MPPAKHANFTLKRIARAVPAALAAHRFTALQRSGQYSELRFIQRGNSAFDIVGYKWPDKGMRRRYDIGRARVNPIFEAVRTLEAAGAIVNSRYGRLTTKGKKNPRQTGGTTANQVLFGMRGKTVVGWINRETPTRYQITYKVGAQTRTVWRDRKKVKFQRSGRYGKRLPVQRNNCPKTANPSALHAAKQLSAEFHGFAPRRSRAVNIDWPKALVDLGACARVDYISRKWDNKTRRYFHEFEKPARVLAAPGSQRDGDGLLIIKGKFKFKPEGITG